MPETKSMADLVRAAAGFQWAMTVYGVRQLIAAVTSADPQKERETAANLYRLATRAQEEFNADANFFATFAVGDVAQGTLIDLAENTMNLKILEPSFLQGLTESIARGAEDVQTCLDTPDARRLTMDRIKNTFNVVGLVNQFEAPNTLSADGTYPLADSIGKAYALGDYPALWAVEGLGKNYAYAYQNAGRPLVDLMMNRETESLPEKTLLMMHAGQGMCFAKTQVANLTPFSTDSEYDTAIGKFLKLCRDNSREGFFGPTAESLGLCCRTWYRHLLPRISERLAKMDPDGYAFFWHGAGRSMFFSPLNIFPGSPPWYSTEQEPLDDIARRNARSGAAWAFTVVNCQQPEIMANFLARQFSLVSSNDAFLEGVISTLIMAGDMYPGHKYIPLFCNYQPDKSKPEMVAAWNKNIGSGFLDKVNRYREVLRRHNQLGEVFRYRPLSELVPRLEGQEAVAAGATA